MIKKNLIKQAVQILRDLNTKFYEDSSKKKPLLEDEKESTLYLQVSLKKIPESKLIKMIKIPLPHSLLKDSDEVCLIVGDLDKKNHKAEIEPDILHYKQVLEKQDITCISQVITLRQLRTDYKPYEAKQKLLAAYDMFLCDKKIAECLPKVLGRHFFKKRKFPIQIDMKSPNLKSRIEKAISTKVFSVSGHGSSCCSEVAYLDMEDSEIMANIKEVVKCLSEQLPGSWNNVKGVYVKTSKSKAIPLYVSYENSNEIQLEAEIVDEGITDALSTIPNINVTVYNDGHIHKYHLNEESENGESEAENINPEGLDESETENFKIKKDNIDTEAVLSNSDIEDEQEKYFEEKTENSKIKIKKLRTEAVLSNFDAEEPQIKIKKSRTTKTKDGPQLLDSGDSKIKKKNIDREAAPSNSEFEKSQIKTKKSKALMTESESIMPDLDFKKSKIETKKSKLKKRNETKIVLSNPDLKELKKETEQYNVETSVEETKKIKPKKEKIKANVLMSSSNVEESKQSKGKKRGEIVLSHSVMNEPKKKKKSKANKKMDSEQATSQDLVNEIKRTRKVKKSAAEIGSLLPVTNNLEDESTTKQIQRKQKKAECSAIDHSSAKGKNPTENLNPKKMAKRKRTESQLEPPDLSKTENIFETQEPALKKMKEDGINMKRYNAKKDSRKSKKKNRAKQI